MKETTLLRALEKLYVEDFSGYKSAPEFKASLKHKFAMKRIFRIYEKNTCHLRKKQNSSTIKTKFKFNRKTIIILAVFVLLALLTGCAVAYFVSNGFRGDIYDEYTKMMVLDIENCPDTIEDIYYLSDIPSGYKLTQEDITSIDVYKCYSNENDEIITFTQRTKEFFQIKYDNEHGCFEKICVNGYDGLLFDYSDNKGNFCAIFWDNGDYIFEIVGDLNKTEIINLAKSTKVLK